ncbi:adenosylmethionine--8-amino-7-oxononanoate transaminase [Planctopirus ephydatiae]|uniref:adenosylmethionine--8-amino-7-oxononanoate transaminase n=1 Tax=Planctopirus ephydatiae TaxID=2528019 RepID=UPI0011A5F027|nr:adenosylmethionine--8-amino-7-oxononanoate transaminase [Planctopirus ephydatiae]
MDSDHHSQLRAADNAYVWHPFTAMSAYASEEAPIITHAEGFSLFDSQGNRYLDGHSSLWCNIHGHRVPELDAALTSQIERVAHSTLLGIANSSSIELAEELVGLAPPGLTKVFYTDCGAAGVEAALKIAWQYHRQKAHSEDRRLFGCLEQSYHGDTVGAVSVGGIDVFHSLFGGMTFPALKLPTPARAFALGPEFLPLETILAKTEQLLDQQRDQLAAVIVEPLVQAAAGILVHPPGYLQALRKMTAERGILLIADEIAVGFGRTGKMLACEHEAVAPDLLVLSKGLTGGYLPLAATLATEEIFQCFAGEPWQGRTFYHGHTYTGNPLACAVALASIRRMRTKDVLANACEIESCLRQRIQEWQSSEPAWLQHVGQIRHLGTMMAIDLVHHREPMTPYPAEARAGHQVTLACRKRGIIQRNIGDSVILYPAPAMPVNLVEELLNGLEESLAEVTSRLQPLKSMGRVQSSEHSVKNME